VVLDRLKTRIFADGADLASIQAMRSDPRISGFTMNPTLMRSAGLTDYEQFARLLLETVTSHPVSLEVCADEPGEIRRQAERLASWGSNVFVKVPITTTRRESLTPVVRDLAGAGVQINVTAVFTVAQVERSVIALTGGPASFVSVFAGRIADAGVDPLPIVAESVKLANDTSGSEIIWASPREVLNLVQADSVGCHVITMTEDLIKKLPLLGKDLEEFSRETVEMFHRDASAAGLSI
jgi:transaldolase